MGPIGCPETSVRNYHSTLHNTPEEHRLHPLYTGCHSWLDSESINILHFRHTFIALCFSPYVAVVHSNIQGHYFIWQLPCVNFRSYLAARVGVRVNGLPWYEKWVERKWSRYLSDKIMIYIMSNLSSEITINFTIHHHPPPAVILIRHLSNVRKLGKWTDRQFSTGVLISP